MAINILSATNKLQDVNGPSSYLFTDSISVAAGAGNRLALWVAFSSAQNENRDPTIVSATFGGSVLTQLHTGYILYNTVYYRTWIYYLKNPGTGVKSLSVEFATQSDYGQNKTAGTLFILDNVNQSSTFSTVANGTSATLSGISSALGRLVIDICSSVSDADPSGAGAGQTDQYSIALFGSLAWGDVGISYKTGTGATDTMSWSSGFATSIYHAGFSIAALAGTSTSPSRSPSLSPSLSPSRSPSISPSPSPSLSPSSSISPSLSPSPSVSRSVSPSASPSVSPSVSPSLPPPDAFSKISPINGELGVNTIATLYWETASGATSYEYAYGSSPSPTNWTSVGSNTNVTLNDLISGTKYYWGVRAVNVSNMTYANSNAYWEFTVGSSSFLVFFLS